MTIKIALWVFPIIITIALLYWRFRDDGGGGYLDGTDPFRMLLSIILILIVWMVYLVIV